MISKLALSSLLFSAGLIHLIRPELFNPAIPFGPKLEINIIVGIFEIGLTIFLWHRKTQDKATLLTAFWFLILTPVHIYVSYFEIPIFGVSDPLVLWMRTLFQGVLFFWALSLQDKGWIISQRWSDVLFLHFEVDPEELQKKVPFQIDLFEGKAIVSIVPFVMGRIRFPFLPIIPGLSRLLELNLRTYVTVSGKPCVYFFTLDANHLPGVLIARTFFQLPYRMREMTLIHDKNYQFESEYLKIKGSVLNEIISTDFDRWATERYALVTKFLGRDLIGVIEHNPWSLQKAQIDLIQDNFSKEFIGVNKLINVSYAKSLDVKFRPFRFLS
jgi:uncharacterized protein YqjF (DUF2071 family)